MFEASSVDEYGRGSLDTRLAPVLKVMVDFGRYLGTIHLSNESVLIQVELASNFQEFLIAQFSQIIEELILKLPKLALPVGGKGRRCGLSGFLMHLEGKVLDDEFHFVRIALEHLLK